MILRNPLALANWKMAMTIAESLAFVKDFQTLAADALEKVEIILCPPYTALWPVAQALGKDRPQADDHDRVPSLPETPDGTYTPPTKLCTPMTTLQLGAQNLAATTDLARTGQISAVLLADAGCEWVMLGHWEVRRHLGDDDTIINRKLHLALEAGLRPVLFVGEARDETASTTAVLENHLRRALEGCTAEQVACMAFVYEPEGAIGVGSPVSLEHVEPACTFIRSWLRVEWGQAAAERARVIYGGSVTPETAPELLACSDLDGLAATRRGRNSKAFAEMVRLIAAARGGSTSSR
ncbi:MAG: triose-phosphate isomerase [Anaerolineae bacterium]